MATAEENELPAHIRESHQAAKRLSTEETRELANSVSMATESTVAAKATSKETQTEEAGTREIEANVRRPASMWTAEEKESFMACYQVDFYKHWAFLPD